MAKTLLRHSRRLSSHMLSAREHLRQRMHDLKAEIDRIEDENDLLAAEAGEHTAPGPRFGTHLGGPGDAAKAPPGVTCRTS